MRNGCRLTTAAVLIVCGTNLGAWAGNDSQGGLEARLRDLNERFETRRQHSEQALRLGAGAHRAGSAAGDFIVNNDGFGGTSNQTQLIVARQSDGSTIAVWTDDRDANLSVYGQIFDGLGNPIEANFRLHSDPENLDQLDPAIVVRPDGGFYGAFTQVKTNGDRDVIVQRFSGLGQRLGGSVNVSTDSNTFVQRRPALTLLSNGDLAVIYERDNLTTPNSNIYGQVMAKDALTRKGPRFIVSADLTVGSVTVRYDEREPAAALSGPDTLWVVWTDNRDGGVRDVFGQRMYRKPNDSTVRVGAAFKLNDEPVSANAFQNTPRVATFGDGSGLVVWADYRNGNWDIFKQDLSRAGAKIGANIRVNSSGLLDQVAPSLSAADTTALVVWTDFRGGGSSVIYAQKYVPGGSAWGGNFIVSSTVPVNQSGPGAGVQDDGSYAVGWSQPESGKATGYYRRFSVDDVGAAAVPVAEIVISAKQVRPACAMGSGGDVFALWEESRTALPDVVGQALDNNLTKPQGDQKVNDGPAVFHFLPSVGVGGTQGFAVWEDYRDTIQPVYSDLYLRGFTLTASGYTPQGSNVRIIDTVESQDVRLSSWNPDVGVDAAGNAMVVWQDNRLGSWDIFAARYSDSTNPATGSPVRLGRNFRVDEAPLYTKQILPRVDVNETGQTCVVWEDTRNGSYAFEARARIYSGAGATAVGGEIALETDSTHLPRNPDVAVASDGTFAIAYEDYSDPADVNVYLQRFDATGQRIPGTLGDPMLLNDDGLGVQQFFPRIAAVSGGYVVVWQDERSGDWDIYAVFVQDGAATPNVNYLVNDAETTDQTVPAIAAVRATNQPFICWEDLRLSGTAPDIFGNRNAPALATAVDDDAIAVRPDSYDLAQNIPNPFNPQTEIRFALARAADVELVIYNTLGQRVRTLVDGSLDAGEHRATWDGRDTGGTQVASGTYFYRLVWDEGEVTRKMTLLR